MTHPADAARDREDVAVRLIAAYVRAREGEDSAPLRLEGEDLWSHIVAEQFAELLEILEKRDAKGLGSYLQHFGEGSFIFGGLTLTRDAYVENATDAQNAHAYVDTLVSLAEALGVLPLENPEQPLGWGQNLYADVDRLMDRIEESVGIPVLPPGGAVPVVGIETRHGPVHYRHLNALYAASRLRALLPTGGAVCEYGGGLGLVACFTRRFAPTDYTLFDLPISNLFAGHYLIHTLGDDAVDLYGEPRRPDTIKVLPFWECAEAAEGAFALSLNQDSFPEIDASLVRSYLREIGRTTSRYFLSINHESGATIASHRQSRLADLSDALEGFVRAYRMRYWLRLGYVEELYERRVP